MSPMESTPIPIPERNGLLTSLFDQVFGVGSLGCTSGRGVDDMASTLNASNMLLLTGCSPFISLRHDFRPGIEFRIYGADSAVARACPSREHFL